MKKEKIIKTRQIGEVFKCQTGDTVICEKISPPLECRGCIYADNSELACRADATIGTCSPALRNDNNSVIFRKIKL